MLAIFLLCSQLLFATTFEVVGPNSILIPKEEVQVNPDHSLGKITVDFFKQKQLNFEGNESGIVSINQLGNWIDVISDTEMKAYGWCFSINGEVPETMSDQTFLTNQNDKIRWFYAYAHYLNGEWIDQCRKIYQY
jgi:hypothetical protein